MKAAQARTSVENAKDVQVSWLVFNKFLLYFV